MQRKMSKRPCWRSSGRLDIVLLERRSTQGNFVVHFPCELPLPNPLPQVGEGTFPLSHLWERIGEREIHEEDFLSKNEISGRE